LDGTVTREFFDRKSELWREEQSKISAEIAAHQNANLSYIDSGVRILELAQRAEILYQTQPMQARRKLLRFVFQNSTWKHGHLNPVYRKPFDFLVENYQRAKQADAGSTTKMSVNENWLSVVNAYRKLLLTPSPEMRILLDSVGNFTQKREKG
jgi:hypothetical protein